MKVLKEVERIAALNEEREELINELKRLKILSLADCQIEKAYYIDDCIEKDDKLYSKDGNNLGIRMRNTYYLLKAHNKPFGVMYFASEKQGRFIGIPFVRD